MSKHVSDFRDLIAAEPALAEQVRGIMASGGGGEGLLALARGRGLKFTQAEADEVLADAELSELELDLVAGGPPNCGSTNV